MLDVPHTEMEESFVHTAEGQEVKLTCTIHCSPKCEVGISDVKFCQLPK